jgi:hypothetical protein
LLFNQTLPPTGTNSGDWTLLSSSTSGIGSPIFSTNSTPKLIRGARYYLGVQNLGLSNVTAAVRVDFDLTRLSNGIPVTGTIPANSPPRFFFYDVSSNGTAVAFQLLNLNGNVQLVARKGPPVPSLMSFDYGSFNPRTNAEDIIIFTNSLPVPLGPGRWYLGVFNVDTAAVTYTILANEYTNAFPNIITLFSGVPYANTNAGGTNNHDYYRFVVSTNAVRAQFEINNPTADLALVARKGLPLPNLSSYDLLSTNSGTRDELIVFFDFSQPVRLTPGNWFLTAVNSSSGPSGYSIKATEFFAYATNIVITNWAVVSNSFCLTWISEPGIHYFVQGMTEVNFTNWVSLSGTLMATDFLTTYCVPLPSSFHFFRVGEGLAPETFPAPLVYISRTGTGLMLQWLAPTSQEFQVQWSAPIAPPAWNTFSNIVTSITGTFTFLDDGSQSGGLSGPRFYRLVLRSP